MEEGGQKISKNVYSTIRMYIYYRNSCKKVYRRNFFIRLSKLQLINIVVIDVYPKLAVFTFREESFLNLHN